MRKFTEVQTTKSGRHYFAAYDKKSGDKAYVELKTLSEITVCDFVSQIYTSGVRKSYATFRRNSHVKRIKYDAKKRCDMIVREQSVKDFSALETAKVEAERLDNTSGL